MKVFAPWPLQIRQFLAWGDKGMWDGFKNDVELGKVHLIICLGKALEGKAPAEGRETPQHQKRSCRGSATST